MHIIRAQEGEGGVQEIAAASLDKGFPTLYLMMAMNSKAAIFIIAAKIIIKYEKSNCCKFHYIGQ